MKKLKQTLCDPYSLTQMKKRGISKDKKLSKEYGFDVFCTKPQKGLKKGYKKLS